MIAEKFIINFKTKLCLFMDSCLLDKCRNAHSKAELHCKYFKLDCPNFECKLRHFVPKREIQRRERRSRPRKINEICKRYVKYSKCKRSCLYQHPELCSQWMKYGYCRNKDDCKFSAYHIQICLDYLKGNCFGCSEMHPQICKDWKRTGNCHDEKHCLRFHQKLCRFYIKKRGCHR